MQRSPLAAAIGIPDWSADYAEHIATPTTSPLMQLASTGGEKRLAWEANRLREIDRRSPADELQGSTAQKERGWNPGWYEGNAATAPLESGFSGVPRPVTEHLRDLFPGFAEGGDVDDHDNGNDSRDSVGDYSGSNTGTSAQGGTTGADNSGDGGGSSSGGTEGGGGPSSSGGSTTAGGDDSGDKSDTTDGSPAADGTGPLGAVAGSDAAYGPQGDTDDDDPEVSDVSFANPSRDGAYQWSGATIDIGGKPTEVDMVVSPESPELATEGDRFGQAIGTGVIGGTIGGGTFGLGGPQGNAPAAIGTSGAEAFDGVGPNAFGTGSVAGNPNGAAGGKGSVGSNYGSADGTAASGGALAGVAGSGGGSRGGGNGSRGGSDTGDEGAAPGAVSGGQGSAGVAASSASGPLGAVSDGPGNWGGGRGADSATLGQTPGGNTVNVGPKDIGTIAALARDEASVIARDIARERGIPVEQAFKDAYAHVVTTVINRAAQTGKTIGQVIGAKGQFEGVGREGGAQNLPAASPAEVAAVTSILQDLPSYSQYSNTTNFVNTDITKARGNSASKAGGWAEGWGAAGKGKGQQGYIGAAGKGHSYGNSGAAVPAFTLSLPQANVSYGKGSPIFGGAAGPMPGPDQAGQPAAPGTGAQSMSPSPGTAPVSLPDPMGGGATFGPRSDATDALGGNDEGMQWAAGITGDEDEDAGPLAFASQSRAKDPQAVPPVGMFGRGLGWSGAITDMGKAGSRQAAGINGPRDSIGALNSMMTGAIPGSGMAGMVAQAPAGIGVPAGMGPSAFSQARSDGAYGRGAIGVGESVPAATPSPGPSPATPSPGPAPATSPSGTGSRVAGTDAETEDFSAPAHASTVRAGEMTRDPVSRQVMDSSGNRVLGDGKVGWGAGKVADAAISIFGGPLGLANLGLGLATGKTVGGRLAAGEPMTDPRVGSKDNEGTTNGNDYLTKLVQAVAAAPQVSSPVSVSAIRQLQHLGDAQGYGYGPQHRFFA